MILIKCINKQLLERKQGIRRMTKQRTKRRMNMKKSIALLLLLTRGKEAKHE